jgi:7,8-dihydropterin-6-yl-methyl-4-(beta-D-ribofuranosyl)aminobenzene 5'-phosphate synthase
MKYLRLFLTALAIILAAGAFAVAQDRTSGSSASPHAELHSLKITILSTMLADEGIGEWGFSALVEADGQKILFDTGARTNTVLENAKELKTISAECRM